MPNPSTIEVLQMLEPWLVRARRHVTTSFAEPFVERIYLDRGLCVRWTVRPDETLTVEDVEAMELLELFTRLDSHGAWTTILEMTRDCVHLDEVIDPALAADAPYTASYQIVGLNNHSIVKHALRLLLFDIDPNDHSSTYFAIRQTMFDCIGTQGGSLFTRSPTDRIRIKLDIDLSDLQTTDATRLLDEVATGAMLSRHHDRLQLYPSWYDPSTPRTHRLGEIFAFSDVEISFDPTTITDAMIKSAKALWGCSDIHVAWIVFNATPHRLLPSATSAFFRSMSATKTSLLVGFWTGVNDFQAACLHDELTYVCLPSAATIDGHLHWAWVAYAIFSCDALHKVTYLGVVSELIGQTDGYNLIG